MLTSRFPTDVPLDLSKRYRLDRCFARSAGASGTSKKVDATLQASLANVSGSYDKVDFAGPGFFKLAGMQFVSGREFGWQDE